MKTNQMNNQSGNEQVEKTNRIMMWTMPLMSLWIGFMMPVAMCVYWIANSLFSVIQELIAGKILKKDYEAARAAAAERERQEKEEEKRRKEEARLERQRRWKRRRKTVAKRSPARRRATPISLAFERATAGWGCGPMPGAVPMIQPLRRRDSLHDPTPRRSRRMRWNRRAGRRENRQKTPWPERSWPSALPETSPIEEEKETAALESVSEAIDGSEEELSGEEAEEAEQDESGEEPDEDKSKDQAE